MFEISRITVLYVPEEDRLAFDIANTDEQVRRLWLTRRLLDKLVLTLTQKLDMNVRARAGTDLSIPGPQRQAAQVYAQLQARIAKKPQVPVQVFQTAPQVLVEKIGISRKKGTLWQLTFESSGEDAASLKIQSSQLRQWLESLHRNYRKAEWPLHVWPDRIGIKQQSA